MKALPLLVAASALAAAAFFAAPRLLRGSEVPPPAAASLPQRPVTVAPAVKPAAAVVTAPARPARTTSRPAAATGTYALTFDDGPHPKYTPAILDWLKENNIRATFFVLGENAKRYPELVKRIAAEGHEIGNHTWSHPILTKLKPEAVRSEIKRTHDLIVSLTGKAPVSFRPPYGALTLSQRVAVEKEFGYRTVLWDADSLDWKLRSADAVVKELRPAVKSGAVILAHDIHPRILPALQSLTVEWQRKGLKPAPLAIVSPAPVNPAALVAKAAVH